MRVTLVVVAVPGGQERDGGVHVVLGLLHPLTGDVAVWVGSAGQTLADVDQQLVAQLHLLLCERRIRKPGGEEYQKFLSRGDVVKHGLVVDVDDGVKEVVLLTQGHHLILSSLIASS